MLTFSSFLVFACPEEDPQSVGGPVTDGNSSSTTSGRSANSLSRGFASSSSGDANLDCNPPYDVTAYGYPGPGWSWAGSFTWTFIGSSSGGGGNNAVVPSPDKLKFCFLEGVLASIKGYWPVLGTVTTVQSLLDIAESTERLIILAALHDIKGYFSSVLESHPAPTYTSQNFVGWAGLGIKWELYGDYPSIAANGSFNNADVFPFFQQFNQQMGGDDLQFEDIMPNPQPHIDC
ncbi:hypothetical protein MNBD_GAMMA02-1319 [hydrothermal vent metagenome]|uniref:Uncharacterized protein n=1 Tax=hydrothermal vent metagenome TaxID=652676 RepID=A0A3B0W6X9_9ZZZZ